MQCRRRNQRNNEEPAQTAIDDSRKLEKDTGIAGLRTCLAALAKLEAQKRELEVTKFKCPNMAPTLKPGTKGCATQISEAHKAVYDSLEGDDAKINMENLIGDGAPAENAMYEGGALCQQFHRRDDVETVIFLHSTQFASVSLSVVGARKMATQLQQGEQLLLKVASDVCRITDAHLHSARYGAARR